MPSRFSFTTTVRSIGMTVSFGLKWRRAKKKKPRKQATCMTRASTTFAVLSTSGRLSSIQTSISD